jgi:plastocyanin
MRRTTAISATLALLSALPSTALAQDTTDPVEPPPPLEACALEDGEVALTREGTSSTPEVPAPMGTTTATWVVDLAGEPVGSYAWVGADLVWDLRVEDFDLALSAPGYEMSSTASQPDAEPVEHADLGPVGHCTRVEVTIGNTLALVGQGLSLTGELDPDAHVAPPTLTDGLPIPEGVPGTPAYIVAPPLGQTLGFAPPAAVITQGGSLTLVGADSTAHNIICLDRDENRRPLCNSDFVLIGETAEVNGVEELPPGDYPLVCGLHPNMTATLTVVGAGI